MYRQQSLITLDQFYEIKPLAKLESILSFIDYSLFEEVFPYDSHKRGPKGYPQGLNLNYEITSNKIEDGVKIVSKK